MSQSSDSNQFLNPHSHSIDLQRQQPIKQKAYDYPFSQYNLFVQSYNHDCNRINDEYLSTIHESELYRFIFQMLTKKIGTFMVIFSLTFLPILNLIFYFMIWKSFYLYRKGNQIFYYNLRLVSKPFDRMIYSPDVCEIMGKNYWFFHISVQDLQGFGFDNQTMASLKQRTESGMVTFMVFDETFRDYYRIFPKYARFHLLWVLGSSILIIIFGYLTYLSVILAQRDDGQFIDE